MHLECSLLSCWNEVCRAGRQYFADARETQNEKREIFPFNFNHKSRSEEIRPLYWLKLSVFYRGTGVGWAGTQQWQDWHLKFAAESLPNYIAEDNAFYRQVSSEADALQLWKISVPDSRKSIDLYHEVRPHITYCSIPAFVGFLPHVNVKCCKMLCGMPHDTFCRQQ